MISRLRDAGIYRWIRAHQLAYCCVICWRALFPIQSNTLARHYCWLWSASARHTVHRCPFQQSWWWWTGFEGCRAMVEFEIAASRKRTASSWPTVAMMVKDCCSTKSLMEACMSSVSLMLRAPPSGSLCRWPSANQTRMMLRAVWYGMPRRAASSC